MLEDLTPEKIEEAREKKGERLTMNIDNQLENLRESKLAAEARLAELQQTPVDERGIYHDNAVATAIRTINAKAALIAEVEAEKQAILSNIGIDYEIPPVTNRLGQIMSLSPTEGSGASAGAPVMINNSDRSVKAKVENNFSNPFVANNPYLTAMMANRNKLMMG